MKTSFGGTTPTVRRRRRFAPAVTAAVAFLVLAIPGWAAAATDLVDDAVDDVADTAEDVPASAVDTIDETVKDVLNQVKDAADDVGERVADPVKDTVDEVTKPVTDAVESVTDTVDEATKPVTDMVAPPPGRRTGGRRQSETGETVRTGVSTESTRRATAREQDGAGERKARADAPARRRRPADAAVAPQPRSATAVTQPPPDGGGPPRTFAEAVVDASRAFRFPLLVAAAVALFLAVQSRLDGRDPKLAAADEELTFA